MRWLRICLFAIGVLTLLPAISPAGTGSDKSPIEAVHFEPMNFNALTGLAIEPVLCEGCPSYLFEYRWFLNGEEAFFESGPVFPGKLLHRGDTLSVEVTPITYDGDRGIPFVSLPMKAGNASPVITSNLPREFKSAAFSYTVEATDPDGDPLSYRLQESPPGMTIDRKTGKVTWQNRDVSGGDFTVMIVVEDELGGRAEQTFEMGLSLPEKER